MASQTGVKATTKEGEQF